ncbi:MAG: hypothetical protein WDZ84_08770 [Rhodovibrionaceae bacterium]
MADHELTPAINVLERKVSEAERKALELLSVLNVLRAEAGMPPRELGSGGNDNKAKSTMSIRTDTFFGRPQQTAVREFLEMRQAADLGPATPREIYEALVAGGFKYEAKDDETALVGLRAMLRKRTNVFVKVGKGTYGLLSWYPDQKRAAAANKSGNDVDEDDEDAGEGSSNNEAPDAATSDASESDGEDAPSNESQTR